MGDSEEQFQELLAQMIGRVNRMLAARSEVLPMALLIMRDGSLDVSVVAYESKDQIASLLDALRSSIAEKARAGNALASCIAYLDQDTGELIAFLENRDNYCARASLPLTGDPPTVNLADLTVTDGLVHVFPVNG